jgi:hypothetical protein
MTETQDTPEETKEQRRKRLRREAARRRRVESPDKVRAEKQASRDKKPAEYNAAVLRWCAENRDHHLQVRRERHARKYAEEPNYRLQHILRARLKAALKCKKSKSVIELVGCSLDELRAHIERQFMPGMSWDTKGWHLDHIRPCASFDLEDPAQQRECFHFSNLRPMRAFDNRSKGAHIVLKLVA